MDLGHFRTDLHAQGLIVSCSNYNDVKFVMWRLLVMWRQFLLCGDNACYMGKVLIMLRQCLLCGDSACYVETVLVI